MLLLKTPFQHATVSQEDQNATMHLSPAFILSAMNAYRTVLHLCTNWKSDDTKLHFFGFAFPSPLVSFSNIRTPTGCYAHARFGKAGTLWALASFRFGTSDEITKLGKFSLLGEGSSFGTGQQATSADAIVAPTDESFPPCPRIAVIGGSIAGVTAAAAISTRLKNEIGGAEIVVYEGDPNAPSQSDESGNTSFDIQEKVQPKWMAAAAKNAHSMVPGAAMHIMSQRHTLLEIGMDTINEWMMLHVEKFKRLTSTHGVRNIDNFEMIPPYFALHLFRCFGPSATWDERLTFVTFLRHFVLTSLLTGEDHADNRGKHIVQLARANRVAFLQDIQDCKTASGSSIETKIGLNTGFVSLHRTRKKAENAVREALDHGERSKMLSWDEATKLEPHIKNLPFGPLFAVQRLDDRTGNCAVYTKDVIGKLHSLGVDYIQNGPGAVNSIKRLSSSNSKEGKHPRFRVIATDGTSRDYDYLVLAAGVHTPLLARQVGAGKCCPTYPLRGYSLTLHTGRKSAEEMANLVADEKSTNLMNQPISVDNIYCSSVGPNNARLAGFGELCGYPDKARAVESVGPRVLARYGRALFPDGDAAEERALQCFRPMSPDDLPLVGEVGSVPGLFLHTGHGTLGWSLSLATAECVAQAVCDQVTGKIADEMFELPDGTYMRRSLISPDRFVLGFTSKQKWDHIRNERAL